MGCGETPPDTHQPVLLQWRRRHSNTIPRAQPHFLSNFVKNPRSHVKYLTLANQPKRGTLILSFTWTGGTRYVGT